MQIVCFSVAILWLIIIDSLKIQNRPRESRLARMRMLWLVMVLSSVIVLIVNAIAFQRMHPDTCAQQPDYCDTLYAIIGVAQSYCLGIFPILVITSFMYLIQLSVNIFTGEKPAKAKRKNEEF